MKFLPFILLPALALGQGMNLTNYPNASGIGLGDRVFGLTNTTHAALLTVSNILSLGGGGSQVWTNQGNIISNTVQTKNVLYFDNPNGWTMLANEPSSVVPTFNSGTIEVVAIGDLFRLGGAPQQITSQLGTVYDLVLIGDGPIATATNAYHVVAIGAGAADLSYFVENTVAIGTGGNEVGAIVNCTFIGDQAKGSDTGGNTNRTAIGYLAQATSDNTIQLGNSDVTNVQTSGRISANGIASSKDNKAAPASISVTASPFSWTNTAAVNVQVFLDANGATDTVAMNGTTIFTSLASADHTVILQPGEWLTVTYSVATPIMKWKEF